MFKDKYSSAYGVDLSTIRKQLTHADFFPYNFQSSILCVAELYVVVVVASSFAFPPTSSSSSEELSSAQPSVDAQAVAVEDVEAAVPKDDALVFFADPVAAYGVCSTGGGNDSLRSFNTLFSKGYRKPF